VQQGPPKSLAPRPHNVLRHAASSRRHSLRRERGNHRAQPEHGSRRTRSNIREMPRYLRQVPAGDFPGELPMDAHSRKTHNITPSGLRGPSDKEVSQHAWQPGLSVGEVVTNAQATATRSPIDLSRSLRQTSPSSTSHCPPPAQLSASPSRSSPLCGRGSTPVEREQIIAGIQHPYQPKAGELTLARSVCVWAGTRVVPRSGRFAVMGVRSQSGLGICQAHSM
jgi:hypothetical protein